MKALLGLLLLAAAALARAEPSLIVFVRHAEKAAEGGRDPALSAAGQRRAQQLADALADAGIRENVSTRWQRTRLTAAPLAERLGLPVQVDDRPPAELAAALRAREGALLVVGHSNTLAPLIAALGGPALPPLCESSHSPIFVLQGRQLLRLRYGEPDPPPQDGCL